MPVTCRQFLCCLCNIGLTCQAFANNHHPPREHPENVELSVRKVEGNLGDDLAFDVR
jgi:hypothetical protein